MRMIQFMRHGICSFPRIKQHKLVNTQCVSFPIITTIIPQLRIIIVFDSGWIFKTNYIFDVFCQIANCILTFDVVKLLPCIWLKILQILVQLFCILLNIDILKTFLEKFIRVFLIDRFIIYRNIRYILHRRLVRCFI